MMSVENRKFERTYDKVGLIYSISSQSIRHRVDSAALTMNVSLGGVQFRAFHPMEIGTEIKLKILNKKQILTHFGKVVRCEVVTGARAWIIAVEFIQ